MIVRNEESFLSRYLLSVKNLANEIIASDSVPNRAFHLLNQCTTDGGRAGIAGHIVSLFLNVHRFATNGQFMSGSSPVFSESGSPSRTPLSKLPIQVTRVLMST
jgi:hypothetical protein